MVKTFLRSLYLFSVAAILLSSCDAFGVDMQGKVVKKVVGPNGGATALVTRKGGPATVAYSYRVYLEGPDSRSLSNVFLAYKINRLSLVWKGQGTLVIRLQCGQVFKYKNFYDVIDYTTGNLIRRITVKLVPTRPCSKKVLTSSDRRALEKQGTKEKK